MKKLSFLLALVLCLASLASCDQTEEPAPAPAPSGDVNGGNQDVPSDTPTVQATLESIAVIGTYQTVYSQGDTLDLTGMKLKLTYSDQSTKEIAVVSSMVSADMSKIGPQVVTVTYEGKTATFNITVNPKLEEAVLTGIEVKGNYKTEYELDADLDLTGMKLKLVYSDQASNKEIDVTEAMISNFDTSVSGQHDVLVTYGGLTTTFKIFVKEKEIIKVDPTIEFGIEAGTQLFMGQDSAPTFVVSPEGLSYSYYYEKDELIMGNDFDSLTEPGYYALVVNVTGNSEYNDYKAWVVFQLIGDRIDPQVVISIESGSTLYIGRHSAPTVTVAPEGLEYEIFYTKDDGATNLGSQFPTTPGIYAVNVKVTGNIEYNDYATFAWFILEEAPVTPGVVMIDVVFTEVDGGYIFEGFVDAEGNVVEVEPSLYTVSYVQDDVELGDQLPTEPGGYALVVELSSEANYEFITLSNPNLTKKVWRGFQVVVEE